MLAVSALFLLPLGCEGMNGFVLRSELDPINQELRSLRQDFRQFSGRLEQALRDVQETRAALERELQGAQGALESVRKGQADLEARLEGVRLEVERLRGLSEEGGHLAQRTGRELKSLQKDLESRLKGIEGELNTLKARLGLVGPGAREGKPGPPAAPGARAQAPERRQPALPSEREKVAAETPSPKPQEPKAAPSKPEVQAKVPGRAPLPSPPLPEELEYQRALNTLLRQRRSALARRMFDKFIEKYPKSELADNAQYWIGESYYVENKYERAILAFAEVQEKYKEGDKVPDAILKQALSFAALGDKEAARDLLRQLITRFPTSQAAQLAKQKLGKL
ncbi:MAG: tol-pal system protein YbgF [Nitrospinota bacterium]